MINFNCEHVSTVPIQDQEFGYVCTPGPNDGTFHPATHYVNYKNMWHGFAVCDNEDHFTACVNWMLDKDAGHVSDF